MNNEEEKFDVYAIEAEYERLVAEKSEIEKKIDALKKRFFQESSDTGQVTYVGRDLTFTYIPATTQNRFDSKGFKKDYPELYKEYLKTCDVKESLRTTKLAPAGDMLVTAAKPLVKKKRSAEPLEASKAPKSAPLSEAALEKPATPAEPLRGLRPGEAPSGIPDVPNIDELLDF